MTTFCPKLAAFPKSQRALWPSLVQVPPGFVLYGGTALALRLAHRTSVDFDFFTSLRVDPRRLASVIPFLDGATLLEQHDNDFAVAVWPVKGARSVKVSFFGGLQIPVLDVPGRAGSNGIAVASIMDIAATKAKAIHDRVELRDYRDIVALLKSGMTLSQIAACAVAVFPAHLDFDDTIRVMTYFGEPGMRDFPETLKRTLREAATNAPRVRPLTPRYQSIAAAAKAAGR